jgi:hypothetical protein
MNPDPAGDLSRMAGPERGAKASLWHSIESAAADVRAAFLRHDAMTGVN